MKNKSLLNLYLYMLLIIVILTTMYFSYTLIVKNNAKIDKIESNGDKKTFTAVFEENGASFIGKESLICELVNNKCEIVLPTINRDNSVVLGWNTEKTNYAKYKVGDRIELKNNQVFYAITYYENKLTIFDNSLDYVSNKEVSCKVFNEEKNCSVIIPDYNKIGYENRGYSLRKDSLTGTVFPNQVYKLKKDVLLYPIYNTLTRGQTINVSKVISKYGFTIEIENGCNSSVSNGYLEYIDRINQKAKYLLIGSKITFLNANTFDKLWASNYVGMNYGPNSLRLFDVKCPNELSMNYYPTIVHELAHTWDFYYRNYFSKNISDENDFINLFSKYKNLSNRPFREYSYSNIREFFADSIRYYYFKYIDPIYEYYILSYPNDIKTVVEKYMCIANNGYNEGEL